MGFQFGALCGRSDTIQYGRSTMKMAPLPLSPDGVKSRLLDALGTALVATDAKGAIVEWNRAAERLYGWTAAEALGKPVLALLVPDESRARQEEIRNLVTRGQAWEGEFVGRRRDGVSLFVQITLSPVFDDGGQLVGVVGSSVDITGRKRVEEALRESELRFRQVIDNVPSLFWMTTTNRGETLYASPAFSRIYGRPLSEIPRDTDSILDLIHPEDRERIAAVMARPVEGPLETIFRVIWPDGTVHVLQDRSFPVRDEQGRVYRVCGLTDDITERSATEDALRRSEGLFRALTESSAEMVTISGADGRRRYVSPSAERVLGYRPAELEGGSPLDLIHPEDLPAAAAMMREVLEKTGKDFKFGFRARHRDGSWRHMEGTARNLLDLPAIGGLVLNAHDASERIDAEAELRQSEQRVRAFFNSIPLPTYVWQRSVDDFVLIDFNTAAVEVSAGYINSMKGILARDLFAEDPVWRRCLAEALAGNKLVSAEVVHKHRVSGELRDLSVRFAPVPPEQVVVLTEDVTERNREASAAHARQQSAQQAHKLEAIGRLAGGIAHDFNNLLTVIKATTELLGDEFPLQGTARDDLNEISRAAVRAAALTRQLLAFSRQQVLEPRQLDLNGVVTDVESMLRRLIGEDIELCVELSALAGPVLADRGQLEQVIVNLAVNARDAMPKGGKLVISTSQIAVEADQAARNPDVRPGEHAVLVVRDFGVGMDAATLAHIFEPFFTTKGHGQGTGLGLATVYGIVEQSGGFILVESAPGRGTTFRIHLPLATPGAPLPAPLTRHEGKLSGTETILLVEDEEAVRTLARRLLARQGYTVHEASGGAAALSLAALRDGKIDLVVTDAVMPQMSGPALVQQMRARGLHAPILYMSGYTDDALLRSGAMENAAGFIHKPFTAEGLWRAVREVLDRQPKPPQSAP